MSSHLERLPLDLHYHILSYLATRGDYSNNITSWKSHPLLVLTAVSRSTRSSTLSFVSHQVQLLQARFSDVSDTLPAFSNRIVPLRWLVSFLKNHCQFCGRRTSVCAKLYPDITCCDRCDRRVWAKITQTEAIKNYRLPPAMIKPICNWKTPAKTVVVNGVPLRVTGARMGGFLGSLLLTEDVERLAEKHHGCSMSELLARKTERREKREEAERERLERNENELKRWVECNVKASYPEATITTAEKERLRNTRASDVPKVIRDIVRRKITSIKAREAGLQQLVGDLLANGYAPIMSGYPAREVYRAPDFSCRDPKRECLARVFWTEFGSVDEVCPPEMVRPKSYRDMWYPWLRHILMNCQQDDSLDAQYDLRFLGPRWSQIPERTLPWDEDTYPMRLTPPPFPWADQDEEKEKVTTREKNSRKRQERAREIEEARWETIKAALRDDLPKLIARMAELKSQPQQPASTS